MKSPFIVSTLKQAYLFELRKNGTVSTTTRKLLVRALSVIVVMLALSCSPRGLGWKYGELEAGYYPRRLLINFGPIVLIDEQIIRKEN